MRWKKRSRSLLRVGKGLRVCPAIKVELEASLHRGANNILYIDITQ